MYLEVYLDSIHWRTCGSIMEVTVSCLLGMRPSSCKDMYGAEEDFPELQKIMSGPGMIIHDSLSPKHKPDVCFEGTSGKLLQAAENG